MTLRQGSVRRSVTRRAVSACSRLCCCRRKARRLRARLRTCDTRRALWNLTRIVRRTRAKWADNWTAQWVVVEHSARHRHGSCDRQNDSGGEKSNKHELVHASASPALQHAVANHSRRTMPHFQEKARLSGTLLKAIAQERNNSAELSKQSDNSLRN